MNDIMMHICFLNTGAEIGKRPVASFKLPDGVTQEQALEVSMNLLENKYITAWITGGKK